jgi:GTPase SAR1 family protein
MGACICTPFGGPKKNVLLLVGLDAAGKTTWLYHLQAGKPLEYTQPTVVSNYEDIVYKDTSFALWDLGGQHVYRSYLWFGSNLGICCFSLLITGPCGSTI